MEEEKGKGEASMLYDTIALDPQKREPLYSQLYREIRDSIEKGYMEKGIRMPSIRRFSEDLGISRTTVQGAYQQLCVEGYLKSEPQRGYFVQGVPRTHRESGPLPVSGQVNKAVPVAYDFGTQSVDARHTDSARWRRHIREVLTRTDEIASYGNPQGEESLRQALSAYAYSVRGVVAPPERILIGAGTQPLLVQLCALLTEKRVALKLEEFPQAERVFADGGFSMVPLPEDENGPLPEKLRQMGVRQVLLNPAAGRVIPPGRRQELIAWAQEQEGLLMEDDYNGELRYRARPVPAIQGMGGQECVAYIGSFSKLLLPSVRLGYMVLPEKLCRRYRDRSMAYHQTASKIEQLALADYMAQGQLERHLRRMRKLYAEKSGLLIREMKKNFGSRGTVTLQETSLTVKLELPPLSSGEAAEEAAKWVRQDGIRVRPAPGGGLILGFSGIPTEKIPQGVQALAVSLRRWWEKEEKTGGLPAFANIKES